VRCVINLERGDEAREPTYIEEAWPPCDVSSQRRSVDPVDRRLELPWTVEEETWTASQ
jgi:hypothetical protein